MLPQFWDKLLENFPSGLNITNYFLSPHIDRWIIDMIVDKRTQVHR